MYNSINVHIIFIHSDPSMRHMRKPTCSIRMAHLKPNRQPVVEPNRIHIEFKERIYNAAPEVIPVQPTGRKYISFEHFTWKVPSDVWQQVMTAVRLGDAGSIRELGDQVEIPHTNPARFVTDVSSEVPNIAHEHQMCWFTLALSRSSVMQIQLSAAMDRGLLSPRIQLMKLTKSLDICLEHRDDPVLCYVDVSKHGLVKKTYRTLDEYKDGWMYQVAIEGAQQSVKNEKSITIHNVEIKWYDQMNGAIYMPKGFCGDRYIKLNGTKSHHDAEDSDEEYEEEVYPGVPLDYFCIRYSNLPSNTPEEDTTRYAIDFGKPVTWIGHCLSQSVSIIGKEDEQQFRIQVQLFENMTPCPIDLRTIEKTAASDNRIHAKDTSN